MYSVSMGSRLSSPGRTGSPGKPGGGLPPPAWSDPILRTLGPSHPLPREAAPCTVPFPLATDFNLPSSWVRECKTLRCPKGEMPSAGTPSGLSPSAPRRKGFTRLYERHCQLTSDTGSLAPATTTSNFRLQKYALKNISEMV